MSKTRANPPLPTVSHRAPDGLLVELLHDPVLRRTEFAVCQADGTVSIEPQVDLPSGERLVPYSAANNLLASGCVLLPSAVGDFGDKGDLVEEIRRFLHRYVDLSPLFEEIAAYYVLLSWVYDAFQELPYLRFRGDYGTGKTRALLAVGSLCYKPFFASGASTVSPIFHVLDAFRGTLVLDEADFRFSDATAELTKILNNGNADGLPVLRTMTNRHRELNPTAFRVFGPKLIAMRESFSDRALESRFLTEETGSRPLRSDIPISLPASLKAEAEVLRNKLLAWRFSALRTVGPDAGRLIDGVEPRVNQTALALLSLVDDEDLRGRLESSFQGTAARTLADRAGSVEAAMLHALVAAFQGAVSQVVSVADVAARFNAIAAQARPSTNKWVGTFLRTRLRLSTYKSRGIYVVPQSEWTRVTTLAARHGVSTVVATDNPQRPGTP